MKTMAFDPEGSIQSFDSPYASCPNFYSLLNSSDSGMDKAFCQYFMNFRNDLLCRLLLLLDNHMLLPVS